MIDPALLAILCCPETHQGLKPAGPKQIEDLNAQIAAGRVRNRADQPVTERIDGGLVCEDGHNLYIVRRGIPVMLVDEAISLKADPAAQ